MEIVNWLQLVTNVVLVVVTGAYVIYTKKLLDTSIRQSNLVSNPVIGIQIKDIIIGKIFVNGRRSLSVDIKLVNIGNGPAIEVFIDSEIILKYNEIDGETQIPARFEPSSVPYIKSNEEIGDNSVNQAFGNFCVAHVLDDFRECKRLNIHRIKTDPTKKSYNATILKVYVYYRNNLNQYFESTYETYLHLQEIPEDDESATVGQIYYPRPVFHSSLIDKTKMINEIQIRNSKRSKCGW
jgi:hypothetical protein